MCVASDDTKEFKLNIKVAQSPTRTTDKKVPKKDSKLKSLFKVKGALQKTLRQKKELTHKKAL